MKHVLLQLLQLLLIQHLLRSLACAALQPTCCAGCCKMISAMDVCTAAGGVGRAGSAVAPG